jgi:hypothetical protein
MLPIKVSDFSLQFEKVEGEFELIKKNDLN